MNNHVFQIIIFVFVNFAQIHSETTSDSTSITSMMTTSASDSSTSSITTNTASTLSSILYPDSTITNLSSSSYSMSTPISSTITTSLTYTISVTINNSQGYSSPLPTSTSFFNTTSETITYSTVNLTYKYVVGSSSPLKTESITNATVLTSVQQMVVSSFNLTNRNVTITVIRIEIRSISKADNYIYDMITDISFKSSSTNCDITCIKQSALSSVSAQNFTLFDTNNSSITVVPQSSPILINNTAPVTTTPINYQKGNKIYYKIYYTFVFLGESPPGVAAQLGMGISITIIGIILIGEIIFFYRKYGLNGPMRQSNYALPTFQS
ncbi:unnamed protein product [Rotaria sp. Silwood1]|nr:unnamed protein product [Rotaria sp. Silwood1]CAF4554164.1 unnamed protein product [Rotaria sp. Silwood1]